MSLSAGIVAHVLLFIGAMKDVLDYALVSALPLAVASVILAAGAQLAARRTGDKLSLNIAIAGLLFGAQGFLLCVGLAFVVAVLPRSYH